MSRWAFLTAVAGALACVVGAGAAPSPPPLPARWPHTLELGMADEPGGAAALRKVAPFGFRYHYLAGGVNTGQGWATWDPDGAYVTTYIAESTKAGSIPVFSYYMIRQSAPGNAMNEVNGVHANLQSVPTMKAYFEDLAL